MTAVAEGIRVYAMDDGWEILAGKTARDNDFLSLREARPADFWFHAAGVSGSHVIARHPDRPSQAPREVKRVAAGLAAFFSKARNAKRAAVHWTVAGNVSKRRGAPAGQVVLKKFQVIQAEPIDPSQFFGGSDS